MDLSLKKDELLITSALKSLHNLFGRDHMDWMVVSGTAVYFHGDKTRKITDVDIVTNCQTMADLESILVKSPEVDGLSRVRFVDKFGDVRPITYYFRMNISGVVVHASNDWIYQDGNNKLIKIPFAKSFASALTVSFNSVEFKIAQPELVFFCKSITRRKLESRGKLILKDLNDCESLLKNRGKFDFKYLENLYLENNLTDIYNRFALPLIQRYS